MTVSEIGDRVAEEARAWIDTPFKWQQSTKGRGCDCKGLLWGVARELGLDEADSIYAHMADYALGRPVPVATLKEGLAVLFDRVPLSVPAAGGTNLANLPALQPGDILLLRLNGAAQHLAIVTDIDGRGKAVHARLSSGRVREARMDALLTKCSLDSAWRWRAR